MSGDPDIVITSVDPSLRRTSKHKLRKKLLRFLVVSLPPIPLSFETFEAHIKAQFETYYDSVIKEVFESLCSQWNQRFDRVGNSGGSSDSRLPDREETITISSDDESDLEEPECVRDEPEKYESVGEPGENESSSQPKLEDQDSNQPTSATSASCSGSIPPTPPQSIGCTDETPRTLSDGEMIAFKAEKSTKKYTRYLQEMYELIKNIEATTSCSICSKLKRRIQKFVSLVGQESTIIQQKLAQELKAHCILPKGDLTEGALEKMRMSILVDKLIEVSMPDILKAVQGMEAYNDRVEKRPGSKEETVTKNKGKKLSKAQDASEDLAQLEGSCSTEPSTKKKRSLKSSVVSSGSEVPLASKRHSPASVNGTCTENEGTVPLKRKKKKAEKQSGNEEALSTETPRAKARRINVKITDSSHPDLE